jgi:hypothetical protein
VGEIIGNLRKILFNFWPTRIYTQAADASGDRHKPHIKCSLLGVLYEVKKKDTGADQISAADRPYALDLASATNHGLSVFINSLKMDFHETQYRRIVMKREKQSIKVHTIIKLCFFLFAICFLVL